MSDFQSFFMWALLGAAAAYIVYLRVQLYISQRIVKAFQASSVIVPPGKGQSDPKFGFIAVAMLILAISAAATGWFS